MRIYNSLSRSIEEIQPINPPTLGLYACGPTVYDYTHIGHLRKYIMDDVLIRALRRAGLSVTHVLNVTDVGHLVSDDDIGEDKMEKGARKYGKSVWEIAKEFEEYFWKSLDSVNVLRPQVAPHATDHIQEQIAMIQQLEAKGFTYTIEDGVYFDTSKDSNYGELAGLKNQQRQAGARVEVVAGKRNPTDFALWKFSPKNEQRQMEWDSPWGKGFPGWHIECSAMSMKYLGEQFEIHTGGIDHLTIHHPNEIAQSENATGKKPFVKYWIHHNFLQVENTKMSKSLGNLFTIDDVVSRGFDPMALRLLFLGAHYRSELNFTWENLKAAQTAYDRLIDLSRQLRGNDDRTALSQEKLNQIEEYRERFFSFIEDDIKTPEALAVMWEMLKSNVPSGDKYDLLREFDEVLGLDIERHVLDLPNKTQLEAPIEIQELAKKRQEFRAQGNYEQADVMRKEIEQQGWKVLDSGDGFTLQLIKN